MATTLHGDRIAIPTSASNPSSPAEGHMYYNSTDGTIKFYDGTIWISTNLIPIINSVGGTIYSGTQTTVTLNVSKTTDDVDIQWKEGSTLLATTTGASVSSGSISVSVPSQVYGQSQGDTISATVINADGTASNTGQWTVQELPTGGSINTYSGYRSHTFTSSGTFNTNGASFSVDALIVAGGGGGGVDAAAGAGAGGAINLTSTSLNGSYPISIGGGGGGGVSLASISSDWISGVPSNTSGSGSFR